MSKQLFAHIVAAHTVWVTPNIGLKSQCVITPILYNKESKFNVELEF